MDLGKGYYSENTPEIIELSELSREADLIENELFVKYDVKRGLRDLNGKGVLTGLTEISEIRQNKIVDGNYPDFYATDLNFGADCSNWDALLNHYSGHGTQGW